LAVRGFLALQVAAIALVFYQEHRALAIAAAPVIMMVLNTLCGLLLERAATGFRRLRPQRCTIYDRYFWSHERLWKFYIAPLMAGTPFQVGMWRLAGVKMGRRVFDDGCIIPEKSLVTIGDDAMLGAGSVIQNHSLEDGVFTSDHSSIGTGVTIGTSAFVHLGVTIGDGGVLDANAFLMKGSEMPPFTGWAGNPAEEHSGRPSGRRDSRRAPA
jgi:non-ribosomal peptide synthetase-like protein